MNSKTEKSRHPYYNVILGKTSDTDKDFVTLCVNNQNGHGGFDHWRIDKEGRKRVSGLIGDHYYQDYWQDYTSLQIIQNVYKALDFYAEIEDNYEEEMNKECEKDRGDFGFCEEDIPF